MMGPRLEAEGTLFYGLSREDQVPQGHLLRSIDRFVDLGRFRANPTEVFHRTARPSIDPEPLIRMLLTGYCFGILSEWRLASGRKCQLWQTGLSNNSPSGYDNRDRIA